MCTTSVKRKRKRGHLYPMSWPDAAPVRSSRKRDAAWIDANGKDVIADTVGGGSPSGAGPSSSRTLQFFLRPVTGLPLFSGGGSRVFVASPEDTVRDVLDRIEQGLASPTGDLRLVYQGRQLPTDSTLAECGVRRDSCVDVLPRLRSMPFSWAWSITNDIVSRANEVRAGRHARARELEILVKAFLVRPPNMNQHKEGMWGHFQVFMTSGAAAALVMLYASKPQGDLGRLVATASIRPFLDVNSDDFPECTNVRLAPIIFELCKMLWTTVGTGDELYMSCRRSLASLLDVSEILYDPKYFGEPRVINIVKELLPFADQVETLLLQELSSYLEVNISPESVSPLSETLTELTNFMNPLKKSIKEIRSRNDAVLLALPDVTKWVSRIFTELLYKINECLKKVEDIMLEGQNLNESQTLSWTVFLFILSELDGILDICEGASERLHSVLLARRVPLNALMSRAKRNNRCFWYLKHKDISDFEARRNLLLMMFPDQNGHFYEYHEMLIDREQLLVESFEYIKSASPHSLQAGLLMEFKNETATGPGVLREWFCLVTQEIFNSENILFVRSAGDPRRFYPNPASVADSMHLDYFGFCGRVIALALMHEVQIGILFDRIFFQQLTGEKISLEDVKDADPTFYSSCKKILEMDADLVDSDALGLTFVHEFEVLGARDLVELCKDGKSTVVNSKNRKRYVKLLIKHRFAESTSKQVACFSKGFAEILSKQDSFKIFIQCLQLEDLDRMLGGNYNKISIRDWKAHTVYKGFCKKDSQIEWFWKLVTEMSMEQRRALLVFWTSVRHLPSEGFRGLSSKLYICKSLNSEDHLPTSHTCFYEIVIPKYQSMTTMRERFRMITQEYLMCSFGLH